MKNYLRLLCTAIALFAFTQVQAQDFPDLDPSPMDVAYFPDKMPYTDLRARTFSSPKIKLYYSRPQLKGREMIGKKAAPYGKTWRAGANEANEITFYQDVTFGSTKVKAGTYSLFAIPGEDTWTWVLHSQLDIWGPYTLDRSDKKEVARAEGKAVKSDKTIEALSFMFKEVDGGAHLVFGWENTVVEVPIKM